MAQEFIIDGRQFTNLEEFYDHVGPVLIPGQFWGRNLSAFGDILSWPPGEDPDTLIWRHADLSRQRLGHAAMALWLAGELAHLIRFLADQEETTRLGWSEESLSDLRANIPWWEEHLAAAQRGEGQTSFEKLIEIIEYNSKYVSLVLE